MTLHFPPFASRTDARARVSASSAASLQLLFFLCWFVVGREGDLLQRLFRVLLKRPRRLALKSATIELLTISSPPSALLVRTFVCYFIQTRPPCFLCPNLPTPFVGRPLPLCLCRAEGLFTLRCHAARTVGTGCSSGSTSRAATRWCPRRTR